ncbi:MAG: transporter substrate-binding domain-containing protein, partial [Clostridia bacterium]|nr:transporter substrate-binding domain-containing protein [Clostridia bacterium]
MNKKNFAAALLAAALGLSLTACAPAADKNADDWKYIQDKGKLTIGYTVFEPMNYTDASGTFVGFETEFAQAVCAKLGVEPDFKEINWDTKVTELDAKGIDCIWNGMTITEELQKNIDISDPYIKNMQVIVIRTADADKYTSTADLSGAKIEAEAASAGEGAIKDDENLSKAAYTSAPKQTDTLLEVKTGAADAAVLDYVLATATVGDGTDFSDLMIIPGVELSVEEYGIGLRKGSTATA